jgi:hypothetical protein
MAEAEERNRTVRNRVSTSRRWAEYLVAVLLGNVIYLFVEPQLPPIMRHRMFRVDLGLAVDFLMCVAVYGLVRLVRGVESGHA